MGIEISGNSGRVPHEAVDASKASRTGASQSAQTGAAQTSKPSSSNTGADKLNLSSQAAQMQALEAQIANLPVVDTQRVQDVQRTMATGSFQTEPAEVADKLLTFEVGLNNN